MLSYDVANELLRYDHISGNLFWRKDVAKNVKKGDAAGKIRKRDLYKVLQVHGKQYQAHRIVWLLNHKSMPVDVIDHINGNRSDNRLENLRLADMQINAQNVRKPTKRNSSGYLGVSFKRGAYEANLTLLGKSIYLGRFQTAEAAHVAYINAKREMHKGCTI